MAKKKKDSSQSLDIVLASLQKEFGKESIYQLNGVAVPEIERISSGSLLVDAALGGGYPKGRIVEILGPESSGKSTLMLHLVAEAQKAGGLCAFVDAENALDIGYAKSLGVDVDSLIISQPSSGEEALRIVEHLSRTGRLSVIVVDSVAALVPKAEIEGEIGDNHVGRQARLMSQALRALAPVANKTDTIIAFVNQYRMKIGVMFGDPRTTPGGQALKYYTSQRIEISRKAVNKDPSTGEVLSIRSRVKVIKNKVAAPFREAEFNIIFGKGIDTYTEILDLAVEKDIIAKSGAWYILNEDEKIQGTLNMVEYLKDNLEFTENIKSKLTDKSAKVEA
jgi:recombination protein RecA